VAEPRTATVTDWIKALPMKLATISTRYLILISGLSASSHPQVTKILYFTNRCHCYKTFFFVITEWHRWKGINRKQSTRWQHLSRLKASAFFSLQIFLVIMKHSNLYLGLVLSSGGWQSLISYLLECFWSLFFCKEENVPAFYSVPVCCHLS